MRVAAGEVDLGSKRRSSVLKPPKPHKSLQSCPTLGYPMDCMQPARLLCPWDPSGKYTGVGCHFLLQGIFPTQGWNPCLLCLLHWRVGPLPPGPLSLKCLLRHHITSHGIMLLGVSLILWSCDISPTLKAAALSLNRFSHFSLYLQSPPTKTLHISKLMCHSLLSDKNLIYTSTLVIFYKKRRTLLHLLSTL